MKSKKNQENNKKENIIVVLSIVVIIICIILSIKTIIKSNTPENDEHSDSNIKNKETLNDTKINNLLISNAKLNINNDVSTFTAVVTNETSIDYHINTLYVIFTTNGNVQKIPALIDIIIGPNEKEQIILTLDNDISEVTKIDYTIE